MISADLEHLNTLHTHHTQYIHQLYGKYMIHMIFFFSRTVIYLSDAQTKIKNKKEVHEGLGNMQLLSDIPHYM